jgi:hypothetical protein
MLDAGCWILDTGCWILNTGCWILDSGCWILDAGYWMPDCKWQRLKSVERSDFHHLSFNIPKMLGSWEAERLGGRKAGMLEAACLDFGF